MKRIDISGLKGNYLMRFQIGIIIALAATLAAFNFTTYPQPSTSIEPTVVFFDEDIPIERTASRKPKALPPPVLEVSDNIIPDEEEIEFIEKKPVEMIETVVAADEKIVLVAPKPKAFKPIEKPEILEPEIKEIEADKIETVVDEMPRFDACEELEGDKKEKQNCATKALLTYVASKIKYPSIAIENGIMGTAIIQFVVEKDGSISQAKVVRGVGGGCSEEALRVVKSMPKWIPGKQRSRPVRVKFTLPIKFQFQ